MLQDVIDLRRNNWKPRREKAGPKTLDQIHKEAEREKTQAKLMEMQPSHSMGGGNRGGDRGGDRDNRGKRASRGGDRGNQGQNMGGDDEWNTVNYGRSKVNFNEKIDAQKVLKLTSASSRDVDSMSLGPGTRMGWGKGSGSAKTQQTNRYAVIQNSESSFGMSSGGMSDGPRRGYSASMGNFNRGSSGNRGPVDERKEAIDAVKQFSSAVPASNGPTGGKGPMTPTGGPPGGPSMSMSGMASMPAPSTMNEAKMKAHQTELLKGEKLSSEVITRKSKAIVDEYLSLDDLSGALKDVCNDFHPEAMQEAALEMISHKLDSKVEDHLRKTGGLLDYLVTKNALMPKQLEQAFMSTLECSADYKIDIPYIWKNLGLILGKIFAKIEWLLNC